MNKVELGRKKKTKKRIRRKEIKKNKKSRIRMVSYLPCVLADSIYSHYVYKDDACFYFLCPYHSCPWCKEESTIGLV